VARLRDDFASTSSAKAASTSPGSRRPTFRTWSAPSRQSSRLAGAEPVQAPATEPTVEIRRHVVDNRTFAVKGPQMSSPSVNSSLHPARLRRAAISILFAAASRRSGRAARLRRIASASTSGSPSRPSGSSSANGFYLRVCNPALAPQNTFDWLPVVTISTASSSTQSCCAGHLSGRCGSVCRCGHQRQGIDAIVAEARKQDCSTRRSTSPTGGAGAVLVTSS